MARSPNPIAHEDKVLSLNHQMTSSLNEQTEHTDQFNIESQRLAGSTNRRSSQRHSPKKLISAKKHFSIEHKFKSKNTLITLKRKDKPLQSFITSKLSSPQGLTSCRLNIEYPQNKLNIYQMKLKLQKKKQKSSIMSSMYSSAQGSIMQRYSKDNNNNSRASKRVRVPVNKSQEVGKSLLAKCKVAKKSDDKKSLFAQPKTDNVVKNINITSMIQEYQSRLNKQLQQLNEL